MQSKTINKKLKAIFKLLTIWFLNIWMQKVTLKRIWRRRLNSKTGNLFCLMCACFWVFWANRWSTFSWILYFVLEIDKIRYLDVYGWVQKLSIYIKSKSVFTILAKIHTNFLTLFDKILFKCYIVKEQDGIRF